MDATAQRDGLGPRGDDPADPRHPRRRLTVRALRLTAAGCAIDTLDLDPPATAEALLAPTLVALGPADTGALLKPRLEARATPTDVPRTPGREFVARVVEPPADRPELAGVRVVADPDLVCGVCDRCRSGLSAHCRTRATLGTPDAPGALRERLALPASNLVELPDTLDDDHAVFALPVARALHAAWTVHLEGRPYVTILGGGVEALLAAQVMSRLNASVRVVTDHAGTLDTADRLRLKHRPLGHVGLRGDQDVVICAEPAGAALATACAMVRPRGKVVLLAGDHAPADADLRRVVEHELTLLGCRGHRLRQAVGALARGEIACDGLITQRFPFHRADAAIRAAADPAALRIAVEL